MTKSHRPMDAPLGFGAGKDHCTREIDLEEDSAAIQAFGLRCIEYLRQTTPVQAGFDKLLRRFIQTIDPGKARGERGVLLGIFRSAEGRGSKPAALVGVLYFLRPQSDPRTWHIALLLLEPAARNQGLGSEVNSAFARWAAVRGAQRITVTVCDANYRALRFWRDRLRYAETAVVGQPRLTAPFCRSHDLEYRLPSTRSAAAWM